MNKQPKYLYKKKTRTFKGGSETAVKVTFEARELFEAISLTISEIVLVDLHKKKLEKVQLFRSEYFLSQNSPPILSVMPFFEADARDAVKSICSLILLHCERLYSRRRLYSYSLIFAEHYQLWLVWI